MYYNDVAVAILAGNQTIRESRNGEIFLPFGSEYKIRIKNHSNVRIKADVKIDGMTAFDGLVVGAYNSIDLERFCLDGDMNSGHKFKFVHKDHTDVQDPSSGENGIVTVDINWECPPVVVNTFIADLPIEPIGPIEDWHPMFWHDMPIPAQYPYGVTFSYSNNMSKGSGGGTVNCCGSSQAHNVQINYLSSAAPVGQEGATIAGGHSNQAFSGTYFNQDYTRSTKNFTFKLLAPKSGQNWTVKSTRFLYCPECGKKNGRNNRYCVSCGHSLTHARATV